MHRTRIKICGICRPADAAAAAFSGADAIGLVFHPSAPRCVSLDEARGIVARLPPFVATTGLFVNAEISTIRQTLKEVALSAVQLHGDETPELVAELQPIRVIKALHLSPDGPDELRKWSEAGCSHRLKNLIGLVLDTPAAHAPGGSGVPNDWGGLSRLRDQHQFQNLPPIILAGGLTPESVGSVIHALRPYGVDVSSGVESAPRQKSAEKIDAFIRAVQAADGEEEAVSPHAAKA